MHRALLCKATMHWARYARVTAENLQRKCLQEVLLIFVKFCLTTHKMKNVFSVISQSLQHSWRNTLRPASFKFSLDNSIVYELAWNILNLVQMVRWWSRQGSTAAAPWRSAAGQSQVRDLSSTSESQGRRMGTVVGCRSHISGFLP